jgi:hypothetical protein
MPARTAQRREEPPERSDVAKHISVRADAVASDPRRSQIDRVDLVGKSMPRQSQRTAAERIREQQVTAGGDVGGLDGSRTPDLLPT